MKNHPSFCLFVHAKWNVVRINQKWIIVNHIYLKLIHSNPVTSLIKNCNLSLLQRKLLLSLSFQSSPNLLDVVNVKTFTGPVHHFQFTRKNIIDITPVLIMSLHAFSEIHWKLSSLIASTSEYAVINTQLFMVLSIL